MKPPWIQILRIALACALAANALAMLTVPHHWYQSVPGVEQTGAFNPHFVRDIGCAYLVAAGGLFAQVWRPAWQPAALSGAAFLLLHAGVHAWDLAAGRCGSARFLADAPAVVGPALLSLWLGMQPRKLRHA